MANLGFSKANRTKVINSFPTKEMGKEGDIIIFPSDIIHFVTPHEEETDRVSISMNLQLC